MKESFQDLIGGAAQGGWDWFDRADGEIQKRLDVRRDLEGEDAKAVARAWAEFSRTPGGEKALLALFNSTIRRTVFFVNLGLDPMSMAVFGAFREGQNALAEEIKRQIFKGLNEEAPKPRDV